MKNPTNFAVGGGNSMKMKKTYSVQSYKKNRRKLWIFNFFAYLCEKIKN